VLSDVVGQDGAVIYLRKFVEGKVQNPLLLVGDEGTGRRFSVMETIREIVAAQRGASSPDILQLDNGFHPDVMIVSTVEDKELGVEPIREMLLKSMSYPVTAPFRFFIVDGVDRMTTAAANAILKKLEEPPALSRFFMLAESFDRVIPTIRSRCGRINYNKLPESFIVQRISKFEKDPDKALVYSRLGEGSVGRATRYWGSNRLTVRDRVFNMLDSSVQGDVPSAFSIIDELSKELSLALRFLTFLVHDVLIGEVDSSRIVNRDIEEDLTLMRARAKTATWFGLWGNLRRVIERNESAYVNLGFQIKTALATTFCGG
jgi:DNA polymerase III subunit delta'